MARLISAVLAVLAAIAAGLPAAAQSGERLALIIANVDYPAGVGRLRSPDQSAALLAAALEEAGFAVETARDADRGEMLRAVRDFADRLAAAGDEAAGFFYYAGHGAAAPTLGARPGDQLTENYLLPARTAIDNVDDIRFEGVLLDDVLSLLQEHASAASTVFVVVDACRNLPFATAGMSARQMGYAAVRPRANMLIAYATPNGETAPDSSDYAELLAREITVGGRSAFQAFRVAHRAARELREDYQQPVLTGDPGDAFCFVSCAAPARSPEEIAYESAVAAGDAQALQAFLLLFPASAYEDDVRARLALAAPAPDQPSPAQAVITQLAAMDFLDPDWRGTRATLEVIAAQFGMDALLAAVDAGDPRAAFIAGRAYEDGAYVDQSYLQAAELYAIACDAELWGACHNLAFLHRNGLGVDQDDALAFALHWRTCEAGNVFGCANVGVMYDLGRGAPPDLALAVRYYRQACEGGSAQACNNLAILHTSGRGVARDPEAAVRLLRQALALDPTYEAAADRLRALGETP